MDHSSGACETTSIAFLKFKKSLKCQLVLKTNRYQSVINIMLTLLFPTKNKN